MSLILFNEFISFDDIASCILGRARILIFVNVLFFHVEEQRVIASKS